MTVDGKRVLLSAEVSSHEKGLALELKLRDLFKSKGYEVLHNVKRKYKAGRSKGAPFETKRKAENMGLRSKGKKK